MNILHEIVDITKGVISRDKMDRSLLELKSECRDKAPIVPFIPPFHKKGIHIIAEVKKASPSKGVLCEEFDPVSIAKEYEEGGATAISVITEPSKFQGSIKALSQIREKVSLPLLRKDFIFDPYQVYQARAAGADAFLLIAAILERAQMEDMIYLGQELGMEALIEVYSEDELEKVLRVGAILVGINNRNLETFEVDISVTKSLANKVPPERVVVSESGIDTHKQILELNKIGVKGFLIGEALMISPDRNAKLKELMHGKD